MNPTEYAHQLISDTLPLRPTTDGTVRYVQADHDTLGTFTLELTSESVHLTFGSGRSEEAHDFLWDVQGVLSGLSELSSLSLEVAA